MIKEHDQQAKMKATLRKLAYADSDKEAPARSLARGFSYRFSLKSSGTSDAHKQTHSVGKSQRAPSKNKELTHLKRPKAFMHGHGHPKLAKKLNDKIPKTVDEMFKRVRAFIREVATGSAEMIRPSQGDKGYIHPTWTIRSKKAINRGGPREAQRNMEVYTPYPQKDTFTPLIKTLKEILAMGKKKIEEAVASGKLAHLVKDIRQTNQRNKSQGWNNAKVINMIREGGNRKRPFEEGRDLNVNIRSRLRRCRTSMVGFSGETYHPLGVIDLQVTIGRAGRSKTVLMEFTIIKCRSPYNVIIGRIGMRSLGVVGSTIHSMIKFPTNQGIVTMKTSREALWECRQLERVQGSWEKVQWHRREEQMSRIREQVILRTKSDSGRVLNSGSTSLEKTGTRKTHRKRSVRKHEGIRMGRIKKNNYSMVCHGTSTKYIPPTELVVHKRRLMAPEGRLELKEKVLYWLKEGLIRKVQHPEWITNMIPVKLANGTWRVQVDYSSLNKACAKDMYPLPKEGEKLASLMGYLYKCFLRLPKEYNQIRMAEDDEEKTRFHTKDGIHHFTHMPKELKNAANTLQMRMEKVLADQRGQNVEIYLEEVVSKT
nr:hypothetical protein [Tanacetum cinerariifolium]